MAIFTAIGTAIAGALFGGSALAASIIQAGLAFAASLATSYLNRPKSRTHSAVQGQVELGGDRPASTLFGTGLISGHRTYYARYGSGDKYNAEVFRLAHGWCDGLEPEIYFYGKKHTLVPQAPVGNEAERYTVQGFGNLIKIRFYDGRPGQGPDTELVAATSHLSNPWRATAKGAGLCYVVVEREYDSGKFEDGRPDFKFVLRGLREYDPRYDGTVPGGAGDQRLNDPATWVHTTNPAVHRLNYSLGLRGYRSGRVLIGVGLNVNQIDLPSHITAANVCDTIRPVNGTPKPTYAATLYVTAEDDHVQVLAEFEDAMAGYHVNRSGLSGVIAGAPQVPTLDLQPDDIRTDAQRDYRGQRSSFEKVNYLSGQYTSKAANWTAASLDPVTVSADVAADGRERQHANDFLQVTDADIAQYLLNIRYRQNRHEAQASVPVSRRVGLVTEPGDWITWRDKTWLVSRVSFDEKVRFTLGLSETSADIYDDSDIEPGPIVVPPLAPENPSLLRTVQDFTVTAGLIEGPNGYQVAALRFAWTPPDDPSITDVVINYKLGDDQNVGETYTAICPAPESGFLAVTNNIVADEIYIAKATIRTRPDRLKEFTPWVTTATATGTMPVIVTLEGLQPDIRNILARYETLIGEMRNTVQLLAADTATGTGRTIETNAAIVRAQDALAAAYTALDATVSSVDGELQATADAITAVEASVTDLAADGLISFSANANPTGGADAQIDIIARAAQGGDEFETGMSFRVNSSGTQRDILINAGRLIVTDGTNEALPMVFEDGVLKLQVANIGEVIAGLLRSNDNLMRIDLDAGNIIFADGTSRIEFSCRPAAWSCRNRAS